MSILVQPLARDQRHVLWTLRREAERFGLPIPETAPAEDVAVIVAAAQRRLDAATAGLVKARAAHAAVKYSGDTAAVTRARGIVRNAKNRVARAEQTIARYETRESQ